MNKIFVVLILGLALLIIDMPFNYKVNVDGVETTVILADGGCSNYYKDDFGYHKKKDNAQGVSEPIVLVLIAAGMAGVGLYRKFGGKR